MTPDTIRRRLADCGPPPDAPRDAFPALTQAAVLVPLVNHAAGMTALFTRRTEHLSDHAGQVSFPGGRVEPGDDGPVATALRETEEEIGLAPAHIEIVGRLPMFDTATGFAVVPVVALVAPPFTLRLDDFEVAEVFEVPLDFLLDPANRRIERRVWNGREREYYCIDHEGPTIWGVTARMVVSLAEALGKPEVTGTS